MATAITNIQTILEAGTTPATEAAGDITGNTFTNTGKQWIEVTNTAASAATVTLTFPFQVKGQTIPVKSFALAGVIGTKLRIGPLDPSIYGSTVTFTPSAVTVTVAVWQTS